ncbi:unnamed protein product [Penicillium glandicola]
MPSLSSFVFFLLLAVMAAYWRHDLFELVGKVVLIFSVLVAGSCYVRRTRLWLLQAAAEIIVGKIHNADTTSATSATEAEVGKNARLRAQVELLEQQLRGTEARVRGSERTREIEKKRHEEEVRNLTAQLATVSRGIKESLRAKDQVIVECRQWRRKFEDLEDLQRQALKTPVRRVKGRPRWAPAYGVKKGEHTRPEKKFTAIAQVAIVNAAWESKLVGYEREARDYVASKADQIRSLHAAATALSEENASLKKQIQATPDISQELAQQQLRDAVRSTMEFAEQQHEERVNSLKQTYLKELMAAKVECEGKLAEATAAFKAEAETAAAQQREVAKRAAATAAEVNSLVSTLAAKDTQLGELRSSNAKIVGDLQAAEKVRDELKGDKEDLERNISELRDALDTVAGKLEELEEDVKEMEDDNRDLVEQNADLFCETVATAIDHQETRDRVNNLERQVADFQTAEAADLTAAVSSMQFAAAE